MLSPEPRASVGSLLWTLEVPQIFIYLSITPTHQPFPVSFPCSLASTTFPLGQSQDKEIISMRGVQMLCLYIWGATPPPYASDSKNITICKNLLIKFQALPRSMLVAEDNGETSNRNSMTRC